MFAENECKNSSSLYESLSMNIKDDRELLAIAAESPPGQPVPNMLLGAVHYLLLKGKKHELREFYPSLSNTVRDPGHAYAPFKDFCKTYQNEIIGLLKTKRVQTNEVRRTSYLYLCFCHVYQKAQQPLTLIEIGTSSGLQLLFDNYSYSYGDGQVYGDRDSSVRIHSEIRGESQPILLPESPPVAERIGVDLYVNDLSDEEDYLWMRALIWPEHKERVELFKKAAQLLKNDPPQLIEGDGVRLLDKLALYAPEDTALCIFHTHVANQMPEDTKYDLINKVTELAQTRDVYHIYNNMWDRDLHLDCYINGKLQSQVAAKTDGHARWFEWKLEQKFLNKI